jgi:hypothetical protein
VFQECLILIAVLVGQVERIKQAGHLTSMAEIGYCHRIFVEKSEWERRLGIPDLVLNFSITLKYILRKQQSRMWTDLSGSG